MQACNINGLSFPQKTWFEDILIIMSLSQKLDAHHKFI